MSVRVGGCICVASVNSSNERTGGWLNTVASARLREELKRDAVVVARVG